MAKKPAFMTLAQAARRLGISRQRIWQLIQAGQLDSIQVSGGPKGRRSLVLAEREITRFLNRRG